MNCPAIGSTVIVPGYIPKANYLKNKYDQLEIIPLAISYKELVK
ncbi:MAG: hypothetical protein A4E54_02360 [Pelotomaculum sp. PtaB.Bin117]|nr:MAG: hypothetical protein A4E54_02360 [Pelotomaculum sp. PtaB.Bin117]OPY63968.1 MAG: hypothetical protein A4E56_00020 [Pelotomaculum sp. PtaU1.Bin065]